MKNIFCPFVFFLTVSQTLENDYHIDVFATATRGGGNDNMDFVRESGKKSVSPTAPETIKTNLPTQFTNPPSKAIFFGDYFVTYQDKYDYYNKKVLNAKKVCTTANYPQSSVFSAPGGNYLSNEIFYRVAKMREELQPSLKTGHFHIAKIQYVGQDLDTSKINILLKTVLQSLKESVGGL